MKILLVFAFSLFVISSQALWFKGILNPQEADLTVVQGKNKINAESTLWLYRTKGTDLAEGIGFNVSRAEVEKDKENLNFFKKVTYSMNDLDTSLSFIGIDFRLVEGCQFVNKERWLGAEYSFVVRGAEENKNSLYDVTVSYRALSQWWGGMDMAKITKQMEEECLIRNKAVEKVKVAYWDAAVKYYDSKEKFLTQLQSTDNQLKTNIANLEAKLKTAMKNYETAKDNAAKAAKEQKSDESIKYDVRKINFDATRDNIVSIVPNLREKIEIAHFEKTHENFKKDLKSVKCANCEFPDPK